MAAEYAAALNSARNDAIQESTKNTYSTGVRHFFRFCACKGIPENVFQLGKANVAFVTMHFAAFLRDTLMGRTTDRNGTRLPVTADYITSTVSAVISYVAKYDAEAASFMRSADLARVIQGMGARDKIQRGPRDSWCNITLGAQFVEQLLLFIDTVRYAGPSDAYMRVLMRAGILMEYCWGMRVYEGLVRDQKQRRSTLYCDNDPEISVDTAVADAAACCHTVTNAMVSFNSGNTYTAFHAATQPGWAPPNGAATAFVILQLDSSKNHPQGEPPKVIFTNAHAPHAVQFCLVDALRALAAHPRPHPVAATSHLLHGLSATALRDAVKTVATRVGLDPRRCHIRGLRIGCCSATTPAVLDIAGALQANVRDVAQGWQPGGNAPYAREDVSVGVLKSIQLYDSRTNTIVDTVQRFVTPYAHA